MRPRVPLTRPKVPQEAWTWRFPVIAPSNGRTRAQRPGGGKFRSTIERTCRRRRLAASDLQAPQASGFTCSACSAKTRSEDRQRQPCRENRVCEPCEQPGRRRQTAAQGLAPVVSKSLRMDEKSLKDELRTALSPRRMRQPRNLLRTGPAMEAEEQKKSARERRPRLVARVFRRR